MINTILIVALFIYVYNLKKKVDLANKIVGVLKIDDLDEDFWTDSK